MTRATPSWIAVPAVCAICLSATLPETAAGLAGSSCVGLAVATNSIFCGATIEDGIVVSHSAVDTHLSLSPPTTIEDFAPGTLSIDISVVAGMSNTVSVLFGDCDDPALSVECDGEWRIRPPRAFRHVGDAPSAVAATTNALSLSLRLSRGGDVTPAAPLAARDGRPAALAPGALPAPFKWASAGHMPQSWTGVTVLVAGPCARLLGLSARYSRDGTLMEAR